VFLKKKKKIRATTTELTDKIADISAFLDINVSTLFSLKNMEGSYKLDRKGSSKNL
jgi:hypothetical protein